MSSNKKALQIGYKVPKDRESQKINVTRTSKSYEDTKSSNEEKNKLINNNLQQNGKNGFSTKRQSTKSSNEKATSLISEKSSLFHNEIQINTEGAKSNNIINLGTNKSSKANNNLKRSNKKSIEKKKPQNKNLYDLNEKIKFSDLISNISKNINENKIDLIIENLKILFNEFPFINKFNESKKELFKTDNFDIFDKYKDEKFLFMINLLNLISIINLLWNVSKENPEEFNKFIHQLNLYFSFVEARSKVIDFILMAPISQNLYNHISNYGEDIFKNNTIIYDSAKSFRRFSNKYKFDIGYYFEEMNTINLLNYIGESNCNNLPRIIYYIKKQSANNLIKLKIINPPKEYTFHKPTKDYAGYNELDLIISMNKDVSINANYNFKFIPEKFEKNSIVLSKNTNYFFEFKTDVNFLIKDLKQTEKIFKRFVEAFKNINITHKIDLKVDNYQLILVCDKNYSEAKKSIKDKEITQNIIYSNPQVGLSILLKFNNKIKYLFQDLKILNNKMLEKEKIQNKKIEMQKKDFEIKLEMQKKDFEIKLEMQKKDLLEMQQKNLENQLKIINEKFEKEKYLDIYNSYKYTLSKVNNPLNIIYSIRTAKVLGVEDFNRYEKLYDCFVKLSEAYKKVKKNGLYSYIFPFIGTKITTKNELMKWIEIKDMLIQKAKNDNPFSDYYIGLLEFLFGKKNAYNKAITTNIISNAKSFEKKLIKDLIIILEVYEDAHTDIDYAEEKLQSTIIYISFKLFGINYVSNLLTSVKNNIENILNTKINNELEKKKKEENINKCKRGLIKTIISFYNLNNRALSQNI